jgi:L-ascorbate metabolism protein UlaG (beta-lactamase superfamily)
VRLYRILRNNTGNDSISLAQFDRFSRPQPGFELLRIAQLAHVHRWHEYNVTHNVSHVKEGDIIERQVANNVCQNVSSYTGVNHMKLLPILLYVLFVMAPLASAVDTQVFPTSAGPVKITPLYHASTLIEAGGKTIYLDPAKPAKLSGLPKADLILITDIHGDHMDPDSIKEVVKAGTDILAPPAVVATVTSAKPIANGETKSWEGWTIEAIPAYNLKRGPAPGKLFHDKGRGNGYVLTYGGKRFYFSGDTEGVPEMRALKNIDVAFVCMNLPYTMPPEEAADAVKAFHPKIVIPYHYHGSDLAVFQKGLEGTGIEVRLLEWYPK